MSNIVSSLSKMWHKVLNLESRLFSALKEGLRLNVLSSKEPKLISILDFAQIENNITVITIANTPKRQRRDCKSIHCIDGLSLMEKLRKEKISKAYELGCYD